MITIGTIANAAASGRLVVKLRDDDGADELLARADQVRRDEVAERQREGEDRAGDDRREDERQDHAAERVAGLGAEIVGGAEQRVGDPLQARVDRDDHVRQPDVAHHEPDGDEAVAGPLIPSGSSTQLRTPSSLRMARQAKALTR